MTIVTDDAAIWAQFGDAPERPDIYMRLSDIDLDLPLGKDLLSALRRRRQHADAESRIQVDDKAAYVRALSDITLDIESGDRVGLVGANGAGKSTLLRVLAGIYAPTRGKCSVRGKISTLFTSTVGVNPNASGRENIFLSGRTLGMSRARIASIEQGVIDFADLQEFIDLPIHTYSSGMRARLGFAIATALEPEILLIDEVFGVGDTAFRRKAEARVSEIMRNAGILVIATHAEGIIRQFCNKVCWIDAGHLAFYGDLDQGLGLYAASTKSAV